MESKETKKPVFYVISIALVAVNQIFDAEKGQTHLLCVKIFSKFIEQGNHHALYYNIPLETLHNSKASHYVDLKGSLALPFFPIIDNVTLLKFKRGWKKSN